MKQLVSNISSNCVNKLDFKRFANSRDDAKRVKIMYRTSLHGNKIRENIHLIQKINGFALQRI